MFTWHVLLAYKKLSKFRVIISLVLFIILIGNINAVPLQIVHAQVVKDIVTNPKNIKVGDIFQINVTIINNSTKPIAFPGNPHDSPISVVFRSNNVVILGNQATCGLRSFTVDLLPGQTISVSAPGCGAGIAFKATGFGRASAEITFSYETSPVPGKTISNSITKSFQFDIT